MFARTTVTSLVRITSGLQLSRSQIVSALPRCFELRKQIDCGPFRSRAFIRELSTGGTKKKDADQLEHDPFLSHRMNIEKAKAALEQMIKPGMSEEQLLAEVDKAYDAHIPPVPHWSEIEREHDAQEAKMKLDRLQLERKKSQGPQITRIPQLDALGRSYSTGKRKTSVARVWVTPGHGNVIVNKSHMVDYFHRMTHREEIFQPLQVTGRPMAFDVWCTVKGGGLTGQAGAIKLGVARALQAFDPSYRHELKKYKLLTQDIRKVERKKPGRAKARRSFQWVKR